MDSLFKDKYSLAKIFVMNSHFVISACLNGDYCFIVFCFFFEGGGSTLLLIVCCLFFWQSLSDFVFILFSYTSPTELTQSLCEVK